MKRYFLLTCVFTLFYIASYAQDSKGIVEEHKSELISRLQKQRMLMGSNMPSGGGFENIGNKPGVPLKTGRKVTARGYRVQIYSGSSRSEAYGAQARFKKVYQDLNTYLSYEQPNYRVKVGDFTSRSQAQALMNQLRKNFSAVFIFTETVNIEY
jgi:hypothetical protein